MEITGGCACGQLRYRSAGPVKFALRCACRSCQRDSGGGHGTHAAVAREGFVLTGEAARWRRTGRSGLAVEKLFCPVCGCAVCGLPERAPATAMLVAGSLDDPALIAPERVIYRHEAPPWDLLPKEECDAET
ncbi:GFA family protein [Mangrovicoccus algicola]|uniref:GFA family protein n=1 Tax=Mangrovicoccus algicola TaxID=2771008 RepID=A0A8J6YWU9_9RHOB|nr:GFA family protein [Mangrovicoccus algicola]MBE3639355.1 GFA family protein [Mangrovicoccus algicola]